MAICELINTCLFFQEYKPSMALVAEGIKGMYCRGDNSECTRFIAYKALGREAVPPKLFPNEVNKAQKIINRATQ